ncbi:EAL domain-containing protein [Duganella sp. BJB488]|uniref:two-component system response regulator n=1 Tax=unclassified Duganella TaxID=2636909 RepID=UPI000E34A804|nr:MULTISPECIES: EAL domain-containing protein [unclassified Duganella]RFP13146.1 EAL domain-containing protein [Duganella sp. BJB489]RFP17091.1 EAL domain-containing protein [Duganella sp. BJB488]RFP31690.1 EAL domain-containing protein [Duganella sp. BJB480]
MSNAVIPEAEDAVERLGQTILIVDDQPNNLGFVVDHLESLDYRVIVAQGGVEALRRIGFAQPDLILLDAMMPDVDGFEVCRQLKAGGSMADIPVIFMTALKQIETKLSAFSLGAVDYVTKPLQVDEVAARVSTHLQLRRTRSQLQQQTRQLLQVRQNLLNEVEVRTTELRESNHRLQIELAERYAAELALHASAVGYQEIFDHVSDALYLIEGSEDGQFRYVQINPAFARMVGLPSAAIIGQPASQLFGVAAGERLQAACQRCSAQGETVDEELVLELAAGRCILQLTMVRSCVPSRAPSRLVGIGRDVTRLHDYQSQLTFLARRDPLTGLPNRLNFRDSLTQALARADACNTSVGVLLIGLDHFREVNDGLGRPLGDRLLTSCAALLEQAVGGIDLVARIGGDEFAILVECSGDSLALLARRLLRLLAKPIDIDDYELAVSCSIGIAQAPQDGRDADTLLCNVDTAMYRAKAEGGNRYQHFTAEMSSSTRRRVEIGNALRYAIRNAELSLHYQPRASLLEGGAVGMEALLRWNSKLLGQVAPSEFIPLAEQNGLILQIGEWVLHHACRQAQEWRQRHRNPMPIAVNLSARQFRDADLVRIVEAALEASGLPPHLLELELTESMLMHDAKRTLRTLAALKSIGVRLAIDDFGTGYSSLSYLKSFPLDYLKIDRSFVRGLPEDRNDGAIVRAIIAMAHTLGLKVIAEGVETAGQLDFLRTQQCDEVQGYFFSRPLTASAMDAYLSRPEAASSEAFSGPHLPVVGMK